MEVFPTDKLRRSQVGVPGGWRLDAVVTVLSVLMVLGVTLDFRAHAQGISFAEEGFFTPEHVFFYSMFLVIAAVVGARTVRNRLDGEGWLDAIPPGYGAGVLGIFLFGFGGFGDLLWHGTFGFEAGIEGLTSPTHLALATGAVLFLASPARAAWRREAHLDGLRAVPVAVSVGLALTGFALFTLFVNPIVNTYPATSDGAARPLGVVSMVVFPAILVGGALAMVSRFDLPAGALTLTLAIPGLASAVPAGNFALAVPVVLAGLVADAFLTYGPPLTEHPRVLRAFGVVVPFTFAASYFLAIELLRGIAWVVHIWTGAILYAAFAGLLLTYVVQPDGVWAVRETGD